jgi:hypothetical protein
MRCRWLFGYVVLFLVAPADCSAQDASKPAGAGTSKPTAAETSKPAAAETSSKPAAAETSNPAGEEPTSRPASRPLGPGFKVPEVFWIHVTTVGAFTFCVCVGIIALRNQTDVLKGLLKKTSSILRILTVVFVIWATTALATIDRLDQGVTAIFGAIVGYVFGTIRNPGSPAPSGNPPHE